MTSDLAELLGEQGHFERAVRGHQVALRLQPESANLHLQYAETLLRMERREDAIQEAKEAQRKAPSEPDALFWSAEVLARAGDSADALDALERAVEAGFDDAGRLDGDPSLESMRQDPRFEALRAKLGG